MISAHRAVADRHHAAIGRDAATVFAARISICHREIGKGDGVARRHGKNAARPMSVDGRLIRAESDDGDISPQKELPLRQHDRAGDGDDDLRPRRADRQRQAIAKIACGARSGAGVSERIHGEISRAASREAIGVRDGSGATQQREEKPARREKDGRSTSHYHIFRIRGGYSVSHGLVKWEKTAPHLRTNAARRDEKMSLVANGDVAQMAVRIQTLSC